jgi:hypothetical protein
MAGSFHSHIVTWDVQEVEYVLHLHTKVGIVVHHHQRVETMCDRQRCGNAAQRVYASWSRFFALMKTEVSAKWTTHEASKMCTSLSAVETAGSQAGCPPRTSRLPSPVRLAVNGAESGATA